VDSIALHRGKGSQDCYAFITMRHAADAADAIIDFNSIIVPEIARRPLKVRYANTQDSPAPSPTTPMLQGLPTGTKVIRGHLIADAPPTSILWVGSIGVGVPEDLIIQTFSRYTPLFALPY
jgi:hypothetical protein